MTTTDSNDTCLHDNGPDDRRRPGSSPNGAGADRDPDAGAIPALCVLPFSVSTTSSVPGEIQVSARGEIDLDTAPEFRARLVGALGHPSCATVIVDLRDVTFMGIRSAAVLAEVSDRAAELGVQMVVVATTPAVMRLFRAIGAEGGAYPSVAAARSGLTAGDRRAVRDGMPRGVMAWPGVVGSVSEWAGESR